jgi:hypothetical protein
MVDDCDFTYDAGCATCLQCGFTLCGTRHPIRRKCSVQKESRPGLGDMVKAGLSAIGITEERVSAAIGRPCGCSKRAEQLNELGRRVGIG